MTQDRVEELSESHDAWMHRAKDAIRALRFADQLADEVDGGVHPTDPNYELIMWSMRRYRLSRAKVCTCDQMCRSGLRDCDCLPCHSEAATTSANERVNPSDDLDPSSERDHDRLTENESANDG